jgi:phosphoglucomutase
VKKMGVFDKTV